MSGIFTISLDFELHWGVFDKRPLEKRLTCYANTRQLVPRLLQHFEEYGVHVTWATVGSLFARDTKEWKTMLPAEKPSYINKKLSAYHYVKEEDPEVFEEAFFARSLVKQISNYEGQELASHTFAHYYCVEPGQQVSQFDADLKAAAKAAGLIDAELRSLVFPRNQFNAEYLKVCWNNGIYAVRSNPNNWYWSGISDENTSLLRKVFRTGDTYVALGKKSYSLSEIQIQPDMPLLLPASRLLRAYDPRFSLANNLRMKRILSEMTYAAKHNECYHLWWHPENFGDHPEQNMRDLQHILRHYSHLKEKYSFQSWNMAEYWKYLIRQDLQTGYSQKGYETKSSSNTVHRGSITENKVS